MGSGSQRLYSFQDLAMLKLVKRMLDSGIDLRRIRTAIEEPLWRWIREQVPNVARRVDITARVENKILEFPMARVEELVRGVTERELRLIIYLGYVLGAVIGAALVGAQALLG